MMSPSWSAFAGGLAAFLAVTAPSTPAAADPRWDEYQLLMWQDHPPAALAGLRRLGFTGTKLFGTGGRIDPQTLADRRASGLPYYLENIATDFYAPYHRYTPNKLVTWLFDRDRERRRADPADARVFLRDPSLSDPAFAATVHARLQTLARTQGPDRPLFYNLGDETGIADLAAPWDYDTSPASLAVFRTWLRGQYPDLDALNRQWATTFPDWDAVTPELTDDAMRRTDQNFSAWADFKAWMDVSFAAALHAGTGALHAADPAALSAIEGAQVPGWGGYDYGRLAGAVDVMEIYDTGNALQLARAFNPALIPLSTAFASGPREVHRAWRDLLRGGRGMVVWDEAGDVIGPDGAAAPRGQFLQSLVSSLRAVSPALLAAVPAPSAVAVLYSQASFRTRWMLDMQPKGAAWSDRDSERENDDNAWRAARRQAVTHLQELGITPRWLTSATLEGGALQDQALRVVILPHAIALSDTEIAELRAFAARGGTVLADTEPGVFDAHSRRRTALPLAGVATMPQSVRPDGDPVGPDGMLAVLKAAGVEPPIQVLGPDGAVASGVDVHVYANGGVTILALQASQPWSAPPRLTVRLPTPATVRDLRRAGPPVQGNAMDVVLDGIEPTVLALSPDALPGPVLDGGTLRFDGPSPAAVHAMRLEWRDAAGAILRSAVMRVPADGVALPGVPGTATLGIADPLSGRTVLLPLP